MLHFNSQRWTVSECSLNVLLPLHSQNLPEAWWSLDVAAGARRADHGQDDLRISVQPLFAPVRDWRELENCELKIDATWQDAHEFVNEDGEVQWTEIEARWWPDRSINRAHYWIGEEFLLRFGSWERDRLICELEGHLQPEQDYYCDPPGIQGNIRSCSGLEFLLLGQAQIGYCEIQVPAEVREPLRWAEAKAARILGFRAFRSNRICGIGGDATGPVRGWKVSLFPNLND